MSGELLRLVIAVGAGPVLLALLGCLGDWHAKCMRELERKLR